MYGNAQIVPMGERHPIKPQSPYAATKAAADSLALSFYYSFDLPVTIIRPFNTYGSRQSSRAVIPAIITQILAKKEKIRLGSLFPSRDLIYVADTVKGFIAAAELDYSAGNIINIGSGSDISIENLVNLIAREMKREIKIEIDKKRQRPVKSEVKRLQAGILKAKELLGWSPTYALVEGLRVTIKWFEKNLSLYKPEIYNV